MAQVITLPCRVTFALFAVVRVRVPDPVEEGSLEYCKGLIHVGKFASSGAADGWDLVFRKAAAHHDAEILQTWIKPFGSFVRRVFDFNPNTEAGLPWEVAASLADLVPQKEREEIAGWLELARSR